MNKPTEYFIGIDGGGTKCKARLEDAHGNLLAEAIAGPANAARDLKGSVESVITATNMVINKANLPALSNINIHAGIGLAGLNIPEVKEKFTREVLPFSSVHITSDLHIACIGAHEGKDGAIVIIGTGSAGAAINKDKQLELGGHGFIIGDKGSGAWLGKMAITQCLESLDGIIPSNTLTTQVMAHLKCNTAHELVNVCLTAKPAFFATLAPIVLTLATQKQPEALALVEEAADYINKLSYQLLTLNPKRLSFFGGITHILVPYLDPKLQTLIHPPLGTPEQGAILYSKSQLTNREHS